MLTPGELKQAILELPLEERLELLEAIERNVFDEVDGLVTADVQTVERQLALQPFTPEQLCELNARVEAAERGEASYVPLEDVWPEILATFQSRKG